MPDFKTQFAELRGKSIFPPGVQSRSSIFDLKLSASTRSTVISSKGVLNRPTMPTHGLKYRRYSMNSPIGRT